MWGRGLPTVSTGPAMPLNGDEGMLRLTVCAATLATQVIDGLMQGLANLDTE